MSPSENNPDVGSSSSLKYIHTHKKGELTIQFRVTFLIVISILSGEKLTSFLVKCLKFKFCICIFAVYPYLLNPQVRVFIHREVLLVEEPLK